MKSILLALLLLVVVLYVTAEPRRNKNGGKDMKFGGKRWQKKQGKGGCCRNCSSCVDNVCIECNEGFVKIEFRNKTFCKPADRIRCVNRSSDGRCVQCRDDLKLVTKGDKTICKGNSSCLEFELDGNCAQCIEDFHLVTKRNKTFCVSGIRCANRSCEGRCVQCKDDFKLVTKRHRTFCIPEGKPVWSHCGKGCKECASPEICTACMGKRKLFDRPNGEKVCVLRCPKSTRPNVNATPAVCEPKEGKPTRPSKGCGRGCLNCDSQTCTQCKVGLKLLELSENTVCTKHCPPLHKVDRSSLPPRCRRVAKKQKQKKKGGKRGRVTDGP